MTLHHSTGRHRAAALTLMAVMLVGSFAAPAQARSTAPATPATVGQGGAELKADYDEMSRQAADLLKKLSQTQQARQEASAQLDQLRTQTANKQLELLAAQAEFQKAEAQLVRRIAARKRAERKVALSRDRLRKQIVASYVTGGETGGMVEAFLNSENGEELGQAVVYGHAVSGSTEALLQELTDAQVARAKAATAANKARSQARSSRDDIKSAAEFLLAASLKQQSLVNDVNAKLLDESLALQAVQGERAKVEAQITDMTHASDGIAMILADLQKDQPDWKPGVIEITSPIPGVKVGSPFGMRHHPILGIDRLHAGCDLGAPTGTEIHAPADGVVVLAEVRGGFGNAVVIDHGNSLGTVYGHTSKMLVKAGDIVKRGDVIALVGSTGLSTGPHLHFETRLKGSPIDPEGVIDFNAVVNYDDLPSG